MPTPVQTLKRVFQISSVATSFGSRVPTLVMPSGEGVIPILNGEETLELFPFGVGADNDTFDFMVIGWRRALMNAANVIASTGGPKELWIPQVVAQCTATLSAVVGVALAVAVATDRFADTITVGKGINPRTGAAWVANTVTTDVGPANIVLDIRTFDRWEMLIDLTGTSTAANALFTMYQGSF